jgi:hypothetical protein
MGVGCRPVIDTSLINSMVGALRAMSVHAQACGMDDGRAVESSRRARDGKGRQTGVALTMYVRMVWPVARRESLQQQRGWKRGWIRLLVAGTAALFSCAVGTTFSAERHQ